MTGLDKALDRRVRHGVARRMTALAEAAAQMLTDVEASATDEGVRLSGRGLRRRAFGQPRQAPDADFLGLGARLSGWLR